MKTVMIYFSLTEALQLYIVHKNHKHALKEGPKSILASLHQFLYSQLSVEEIENPEIILKKLEASNSGI